MPGRDNLEGTASFLDAPNQHGISDTLQPGIYECFRSRTRYNEVLGGELSGTYFHAKQELARMQVSSSEPFSTAAEIVRRSGRELGENICGPAPEVEYLKFLNTGGF
jgi:hypothetical protein